MRWENKPCCTACTTCTHSVLTHPPARVTLRHPMPHPASSTRVRLLLFFVLEQLRQEGVQLPNGNALPPLFEFTELELSANPRLLSFLLPAGVGGGGGDGKAGPGAGSIAARDGSSATAGAGDTGLGGGGGQEAGLGQA